MDSTILKNQIRRQGRFGPSARPMLVSSHANRILGLFMLWWGWLAFNCGSTYGISGDKWKFAARAAVATMNASVGGGIVATLASMATRRPRGVCDVGDVINGILTALVSITASCAVATPVDALLIGALSSACAMLTVPLMERWQIDDPVMNLVKLLSVSKCLNLFNFYSIYNVIQSGME